MNSKLRLDDLYKMIAHIYMEQNAERSASATFRDSGRHQIVLAFL